MRLKHGKSNQPVAAHTEKSQANIMGRGVLVKKGTPLVGRDQQEVHVIATTARETGEKNLYWKHTAGDASRKTATSRGRDEPMPADKHRHVLLPIKLWRLTKG